MCVVVVAGHGEKWRVFFSPLLFAQYLPRTDCDSNDVDASQGSDPRGLARRELERRSRTEKR